MELVIGREYKFRTYFQNVYGEFQKGEVVTYKGVTKHKPLNVHQFQSKFSGKWLGLFDEAVERRVEEINMNGKNIKSGHFLIGTVNKTSGNVSFASQPNIHESESMALEEAKRLAVLHTEKKFMVVEVKGIARTVEVMVE